MNWAIGLGTFCALLVCTVIAALFLSAFLGVGLELLVGWLFIAAMAVLIGALLVCTVIAALFLSAFLGVGLELLVGWLFIAAMAVLIGALLIFLHEVFLATSRLRIGQRSASTGTHGSSSTSKRPPHTAGLHE